LPDKEEKLKKLAEVFEGLDEPAARREFLKDPSAKTSGLPDDVQKLFGSVTDDELRVLAETWKNMKKAGLTHDVDGVTVSFL
jgi:hypothetical protein